MSEKNRAEKHVKLFIPGPTEVRPEVLDAQTDWMIGHRMPECLELIGRIRPKLGEVFMTEKRVLINASTGTGFMEAAIRNTAVKKVLNCVNGAFSDRLREITEACGRENEVLEAVWPEINMDERTWTIPAERMKSGREHRVPLSGPAMAVLEVVPHIVGNPYLFPGARHKKPLSNMALLQLMRGMGYGVKGERGAYVPHGFRSSFRDWTGEVSTFPRDVCEMALAHTIENKVEAAYRRGDLFAKRKEMMEQWAGWCSRSTPEIAQIRKTA